MEMVRDLLMYEQNLAALDWLSGGTASISRCYRYPAGWTRRGISTIVI